MLIPDKRVLTSAINEITANDRLYSNHVEYKGYLTVKDETYFINMLINVEVSRDFGNYTGDFKVVKFAVPLGDFVHLISPNRDNLKFKLIEKFEGYDEKSYEYELRLLNEANDEPDNSLKRKSMVELNKTGLYYITGQLVNKEYVKYKYHNVSGIYNDTNPHALLRSLLMTAGSLLNFKFYNVKMVDTHNTRIYKQIQIPDGTPLLRVGSFLQETDYGIYDGDLNTYVFEHFGKIVTFVYPLYNYLNTWKNNRLIVLAIDSVKYAAYEKTYKIDGSNLKILVDGAKIKDHAKDKTDTEGHGINIINSDTLMGRPLQWIFDEPVSDSKMVQDKQVHDLTNVDHPMIKPSVITSNYKNEKSKVLRDMGEIIAVNWKFGHTEWLYPGMPVTYIFEYGDKVVQLNGVLHKTHYHYSKDNYRSAVTLFIFLEKFNSDKIKK